LKTNMVSGKGTPPRTPEVDEDEIDFDEADEVIELDEGDAPDDEDDFEEMGEVMDDDESKPTLFGPPDKDDANLVFDCHSSSPSSSSPINSVFSVALDPSGSIAISGGEDDKAFVWKVADGSVLFECGGHSDSVVCVAFNHDGSMVATGDMAGMIKVWKVSSGKEVWSFECADLEWLYWHPVASVIIAGTIDGSSWMWKIPSGDCKTFSGPAVPSSAGRLHPDGKRLCVGYGDGSLRIWDLKAGSVTHTVSDLHSDNITCLDIHSSGNVLITGCVDGNASLVNPNSGKVVAKLPMRDSSPPTQSLASGAAADMEDDVVEDEDSVEAVALSSAFPVAATGSLNGKLLIWDLNSEKLRHDPIRLDGGITRLAWRGSEGGSDLLFCSSLDGTASAWDGRTGNVVRRWTGHRGQILDMSVAPMGNFLLTASGDGTVRTFSLHD